LSSIDEFVADMSSTQYHQSQLVSRIETMSKELANIQKENTAAKAEIKAYNDAIHKHRLKGHADIESWQADIEHQRFSKRKFATKRRHLHYHMHQLVGPINRILPVVRDFSPISDELLQGQDINDHSIRAFMGFLEGAVDALIVVHAKAKHEARAARSKSSGRVFSNKSDFRSEEKNVHNKHHHHHHHHHGNHPHPHHHHHHHHHKHSHSAASSGGAAAASASNGETTVKGSLTVTTQVGNATGTATASPSGSPKNASGGVSLEVSGKLNAIINGSLSAEDSKQSIPPSHTAAYAHTSSRAKSNPTSAPEIRGIRVSAADYKLDRMLPSMFEVLERKDALDLGSSRNGVGDFGEDQHNSSSNMNPAEARRARYEGYQSPQRHGIHEDLGVDDTLDGSVKIIHAPAAGASQETLEYIAGWRQRHANALASQ
jgi:hypothetical protein